jgi:hypothetical protein
MYRKSQAARPANDANNIAQSVPDSVVPYERVSFALIGQSCRIVAFLRGDY